ncbi:hypothetical protein DPEC_G00271220 [Dallia pectoralis]|uniref:Uncharacterized protein n=1 Tax=Dallia pectoralis TaxID=75939 RepID=A0ACC2FPM1_DALPE|nr:hypothetical protein DPEC_G00271220 [Dallia pectoralis]
MAGAQKALISSEGLSFRICTHHMLLVSRETQGGEFPPPGQPLDHSLSSPLQKGEILFATVILCNVRKRRETGPKSEDRAGVDLTSSCGRASSVPRDTVFEDSSQY